MNNYGWSHEKEEKKPGFYSKLTATGWIILINVIVFVILTISLSINLSAINYFALNSNYLFQGRYIWTLLLHMFSHAFFLHLLANMIALYSFGKLTERIIGRKRFVIFYLAAGLFAGILSVLLSYYLGYGPILARIIGSPDVPMLGASGAIFAVAGLLMMLLPRLRFTILFFPFISFPAYIMLPLFLFLFWIMSVLFNWPIGNVAHFGGFLAGVIYGYYLRRKYRKKVMMLQRMFR